MVNKIMGAGLCKKDPIQGDDVRGRMVLGTQLSLWECQVGIQSQRKHDKPTDRKSLLLQWKGARATCGRGHPIPRERSKLLDDYVIRAMVDLDDP